ncbi:phosphopantetheine-binding protein [Paenactinomyces guangxiensis]|uniref:Carrier domain-containing protein n=1 Tax=Paenactinomyces guangxiensis TaxID=1490290 RepID=A0A7W1WP45_9BACL|nr:phosphopantetheine-binding protein [Paenactinomyces guangxiensis]MBA4493462.1 hypothetical protein [Paenactinomyces guangxiensis]MBH8590553.1 hypothetical protein [Paenactinomyces guangxiensis]
MENNMKEIIKLKLNGILNRCVALNDDSDLFNEGIDSLSLIELIVALEEQLNIQISDDDLSRENFRSINSICNLLTSKYIN